MPIVSNFFSSNRCDDFDDYEDFCGMENSPFVISYEPEEEEISVQPIPIEPKYKISFRGRFAAWIKFRFFKFQV